MILTIKARSLLSYNSNTQLTEMRISFRAMLTNMISRRVEAALDSLEDTTGELKKFLTEADAIAYYGAIIGPEMLDTANSFWPDPFFTSYEIVTEK